MPQLMMMMMMKKVTRNIRHNELYGCAAPFLAINERVICQDGIETFSHESSMRGKQ